jgi:hypothetical protein
MKKLLHQVFGIWTSGKPYDADHGAETTGSTPGSKELVAEKIEAEGRKTGNAPVRKTVTSTSTDIVADKQPIVKRTGPRPMPMAQSISRTSAARLPWSECCVTWATSIG